MTLRDYALHDRAHQEEGAQAQLLGATPHVQGWSDDVSDAAARP